MVIDGQGLGSHESSATRNQDILDITAVGELGNTDEGECIVVACLIGKWESLGFQFRRVRGCELRPSHCERLFLTRQVKIWPGLAWNRMHKNCVWRWNWLTSKAPISNPKANTKLLVIVMQILSRPNLFN